MADASHAQPAKTGERDPQAAPSVALTASIVIVNYNGLRYLDTCLRAIFEQRLDGGFEVIVVDNASHDGSVEHLRTAWPDVRVVEAGANLGFAGGNNLGIARAVGRYVVLINNDTSVQPGWLEALVRTADEDSSVGAVASKLVYMDRPQVIQNAGSLVLTDGSGGDRGTDEEDRGQYDSREEVFAACGCGVLYRREALDDVGLFEERFFCYYEDTDLSWRLRLRGWRIVYEPAAVVRHVHSGTSGEWSPFFIFHVDRNRLFMIIRNAPPAFIARALMSFGGLSLAYAARALLRRTGRGGGGGAAAPGLSRARIHLNVLGSLLRNLPYMLGRRRWIRRTRKVADADIVRWFYPREEWNAKHAR